jgi:prepilin-type N-terminal cleavage/methylation domain-containing protein
MKKGFSALEIVVAIIILLVVAVVILFIFRNYFGKEAIVIEEQLDTFGDCDCDGVRNLIDKCPCIKQGDSPSLEHEGCPTGKSPTPCQQSELEECNKKEPKGKIAALCK